MKSKNVLILILLSTIISFSYGDGFWDKVKKVAVIGKNSISNGVKKVAAAETVSIKVQIDNGSYALSKRPVYVIADLEHYDKASDSWIRVRKKTSLSYTNGSGKCSFRLPLTTMTQWRTAGDIDVYLGKKNPNFPNKTTKRYLYARISSTRSYGKTIAHIKETVNSNYISYDY